MDNLNDEIKRNGDSSGDGHGYNPDPIIQESDESGNSSRESQPAENMLVAKKSMPLGDVTLTSNRYMGTQGPMNAVSSVGSIAESMLRYKWMIIAIFLLVAVPSSIAIWTQIVPKYRARGEVRVRPIIPSLVFRTEDNGMIPLYNSFLNTQVSIIRSLTVLQRVLDRPEIQETDWYKGTRKSVIPWLRRDKVPPMERLSDNLSVQPRSRTEIIDVTFISRKPKDAKLIVDTVLDQYIKYVREMSDATEDKLYRQLVDQYKSLESEIQGREKIIAELRRSIGAEIPQELVAGQGVNLDQTQVGLNELQQSIAILEWEREKQQLVSSKRTSLDQTQARLGELQKKIAMLEWERNRLEQLINKSGDGDSNDVSFISAGEESLPKYYEDAEWRKLDVDVKTLQHQIDNSGYTSRHPDMIRAKKDLKFAEELLKQREMQLDKQWQMSPEGAAGLLIAGSSGLSSEDRLKSLGHQLNRAKYEEELLVKEYRKQQEEFDEFFKNAQLLQEENNELQHKRDLFKVVRQRLDQKNVERNVPGSIEVLMWAFVPSRPYNDRRIVYTAMVLILSLGIGGGAAFLRAGRHQAVYNAKDMSLPMQVPFLGNIPLIHLKKPFGRTLREEIEQNQFLLIESVRVMRTTLLSKLDEQESATVLITSSTAGTGKSSFTKILGKCMAKAGKKVLMIDVDFHKMTLSKWFDLTNKPGFIDGLNSMSFDRRHIFPTDVSGLSVMPAGKRNDNKVVYEEIANGVFETYIGELRKRNTIILLDSSPILPLADATIMSSQVDGTIMVERELVSRRGDVISAIARLGSAGGHLLGVVFVGSSGYERYGYGSSYGYGYNYSGTSQS